ncbi:hypothetical protein [Streptomyces sp. NPDC054837]
MDTNSTAQLVDLAARAQQPDESAALQDLLAEGHRAWRTGVAEVRAGIEQMTVSMPDSQVAQRCAAAGAEWEAIAELVFAVWDAAPAPEETR